MSGAVTAGSGSSRGLGLWWEKEQIDEEAMENLKADRLIGPRLKE
mgnify:CR=1 FL=1